MSIRILNKRAFVMLLLSIVTILILVGFWYKYTYSMDIAKPMEYNAANNNTKLLIATQGSDFKNAITKNVIEHYHKDTIFIKVIDVSDLESMDVNQFNAILLLHTWENWKPPIEVETFVNGLSKTNKNKLVVITTSGQGSFKMHHIDAITGESNLNSVPSVTQKIIEKLNPLLKTKSINIRN